VLDKLGFALECAVQVCGQDAQLLRASRSSLEARVTAS
jgi:hypothetical protein